MVKKIKSPSCGPSWCENHLFQLNPLKTNLHFKKKLKLRLCPNHNKAYNTFENVLPVLNKDNKHYTPLFVLEEQKKFYLEHDERAQSNHEKLLQQQQQDQSYFTMYEPKHGGDRPYCFVCQKGFNDYIEHINSHDHKKNLQCSIFTRYIMQIQQSFKNQQKGSFNSFDSEKEILPSKIVTFEEKQKELKPSVQNFLDFQTIKSINVAEKPVQTLDRLEMQQIADHYVESSTLKELDELF